MKRLDFRMVVAVVFVATVAGCKGDPTSGLRGGVNNLSLNPDLMFIAQGATKGFEVVVRDEQLNPVAAAVTVSSSDPAIFTIAPDSTVPSADNARHNFNIRAVGAGQARVRVSAGGVSDSATITVIPTQFTGAFSSTTPQAGDTVTIASTSLLKFDVATVRVTGPAGSIATILSKSADTLRVLAPGGSGPWTIAGVDVSYVPGLTVTLTTPAVTATGSVWAASASWQTAPNITAMIPALGDSAKMTVVPVSPNNVAVCPEAVLPFGSAGPCMMFRFDLADTAHVRFRADWDGTTATDIDIYVCADSVVSVAAFDANCFEDGGQGATGAKPQTTGGAQFPAGPHWVVIELYAGTTANTYVTILRP
jgi:hypothetical protein